MQGGNNPDFEGSLDSNGKMAGWGRLSYPSGVVYEGFFKDGQFDGEGRLTFPDQSTYSAHWAQGVEVPASGALTFSDALVYNPLQGDSSAGAGVGAAGGASAPLQWGYLSGYDRRLWEEHVKGARAAGAHALRTTRVQTVAGETGGSGSAGGGTQ